MSLPSGLGAGGRGKEKAPCRYLHFEVDWDGEEGVAGGNRVNGRSRSDSQGHWSSRLKDVPVKNPYKLGIGMGPKGRHMKAVSVEFNVY
jgi:mRNA m6A methyltransferase catalytic subunit